MSHVEFKGKHQNSPLLDDKNMLGNIGKQFVKCMRQVTKVHLYHLLGVSDYYVMYRQKISPFCETSADLTNCVTDPFRWFCELM